MNKNVFFDTEPKLPLRDAFTGIQIVSEQRHISGTDHWRTPTGGHSLADIDPQLASLVQKQPPSKFGKPESPSLWTAIHFYLALPALSYAFKKYGAEDPVTSTRRLTREELSKYCPAFPYIAKHYREYHEFVEHFGQPTEALWNTLLKEPMQGTSEGASATLMLERLPEYLRIKAQQILTNQGDSLVGRIVLAYLLGRGTAAEDLNFHKQTEHYVKPMHGTAPNRSLYERFIAAQMELAELEPFIGHYEKEHSLRLADFFNLIAWFGRPHLVEMMIPGMAGAATPVINALSTLFADIIKDGGPDYTRVPIEALPSAQKFLVTQSLAEIGRFSIVKDILSTEEKDGESDGVVLREIAACLYSVDERQKAWSNAVYYVPDGRRQASFNTFRQDIVNILFCSALFAEDNNMAGTVNSEAIKRLARRLMHCTTLGSMRDVIQSQRRAINDLAIDWEMRYQGHERVRLLRFVRQTFGLDTVQPIPIELSEINKGFAGSYLDGHVYRLRYQEAGEKLEMAITLHTSTMHTKQVKYHTSKAYEKLRRTPAGLPYSAWLEITAEDGSPAVIIPVPGRGSFDPFGRVGSPHAGEVIGFGCSVHHASLALILAELASLDANRGDLERVTQAFMKINPDKHERHDLAAFQLAQIIAAFESGVIYTIKDYLKDHEKLTADPNRPQLSAFIRTSDTLLAWAEPQAARLSFGYPDLYPYHEDAAIDPRFSWYDGRHVELPEADVSWHVLNC